MKSWMYYAGPQQTLHILHAEPLTFDFPSLLVPLKDYRKVAFPSDIRPRKRRRRVKNSNNREVPQSQTSLTLLPQPHVFACDSSSLINFVRLGFNATTAHLELEAQQLK